MTILMIMDRGRTTQTTGLFGFPQVLPWVGCPIALAIGRGCFRGVGLGSKMNLGAFVLSTSAAGCTLASLGVGSLDQFSWHLCSRSTHRPLSRSSGDRVSLLALK